MRISSFFVLAGYLAANAYVAARTSVFLHRNLPERVAKLISLLTAGVYSVFAMGMPLAHILPEGTARKLILRVSFGFYGIFIYLFSAYVIIEVLARLSKRFHRTERLTARKGNPKLIFGGAVWFGIILTCLMGIHHASELTVKHYAVQTDKDGGGRDSLRVVLIADLHLGYSVGAERIADMVEKVNAQDADIILVAGDIFDNEWEAVQEPARMAKILRGIKSRYGVYACYGNHDIEEPILAGFTFRQSAPKASSPEMDAFLTAAGIRLLRDEGVLIEDSFYLYGRADARRPGAGITKRETPQEITANMDKSKLIIVLDHQPRELAALAAAGVDIDLCGHTHDGQMFPGNLTIKLLWENAYGYKKKDVMHSIVTSGVGVFGPNMRVGTKSEIYDIHMTFRP